MIQDLDKKYKTKLDWVKKETNRLENDKSFRSYRSLQLRNKTNKTTKRNDIKLNKYSSNIYQNSKSKKFSQSNVIFDQEKSKKKFWTFNSLFDKNIDVEKRLKNFDEKLDMNFNKNDDANNKDDIIKNDDIDKNDDDIDKNDDIDKSNPSISKLSMDIDPNPDPNSNSLNKNNTKKPKKSKSSLEDFFKKAKKNNQTKMNKNLEEMFNNHYINKLNLMDSQNLNINKNKQKNLSISSLTKNQNKNPINKKLRSTSDVKWSSKLYSQKNEDSKIKLKFQKDKKKILPSSSKTTFKIGETYPQIHFERMRQKRSKEDVSKKLFRKKINEINEEISKLNQKPHDLSKLNNFLKKYEKKYNELIHNKSKSLLSTKLLLKKLKLDTLEEFQKISKKNNNNNDIEEISPGFQRKYIYNCFYLKLMLG